MAGVEDGVSDNIFTLIAGDHVVGELAVGSMAGFLVADADWRRAKLCVCADYNLQQPSPYPAL